MATKRKEPESQRISWFLYSFELPLLCMSAKRYSIAGRISAASCSSHSCSITNDGEVSAGLNYHIIPKDTMAAGDMSVAHNYGSHKLTLQSGFLEDDVVEINADARVATRNRSRIRADGFYSYSAAGDSKHQIKVKDRKSALVRMSFQEMAYGIGGKRM